VTIAVISNDLPLKFESNVKFENLEDLRKRSRALEAKWLSHGKIAQSEESPIMQDRDKMVLEAAEQVQHPCSAGLTNSLRAPQVSNKQLDYLTISR
jgi:hypothetical protein